MIARRKLRASGRRIVRMRFELERQVLGDRPDKIKSGYESE